MRVTSSLSLYVVAIFTAMLLPVSAYAQSIKFCYEAEDFPPFLLGTETVPASNAGILVEIARAAAVDADLMPEFIRRPWKRCIKLLINGEVDGIFAAIYLPERENWGYFPKTKDNKIDEKQRLWRVKYPVFQLKTLPPIWNGKTFSNLKRSIGTPLGYVTSKLLDEMGISVTTTHQPLQGLQLVSDGRIDGYIVEENIGAQLLNKHQIDNLMVLSEPFLEADWFLPLSKQFYEAHTKKAKRF